MSIASDIIEVGSRAIIKQIPNTWHVEGIQAGQMDTVMRIRNVEGQHRAMLSQGQWLPLDCLKLVV